MNLVVLEGKKATDRWYPVMLASSDGTAVTGILSTQATAYWATAGATVPNTYTLGTDTWREEGNGLYWLSVGSDEWATQGGYSLQVKAAGAETFLAYVEARDRLLTETDDDVISLVSGVTVKTLDTGVIDNKSIAIYAFASNNWATAAIPARAIATEAATFMAARAFAEPATAHQGAGSVGEAWVISRQVLAGYRVVNTNDGAVTVYAADATTPLLTLTKVQATGSPTITITPS